MDPKTRAALAEAETIWWKHTIGCERCMRAWRASFGLHDQCDEGVRLLDVVFEISNAHAIERLDEAQCRHELSMLTGDTIRDRRARQMLTDRIEKLRGVL